MPDQKVKKRFKRDKQRDGFYDILDNKTMVVNIANKYLKLK